MSEHSEKDAESIDQESMLENSSSEVRKKSMGTIPEESVEVENDEPIPRLTASQKPSSRRNSTRKSQSSQKSRGSNGRNERNSKTEKRSSLKSKGSISSKKSLDEEEHVAEGGRTRVSVDRLSVGSKTSQGRKSTKSTHEEERRKSEKAESKSSTDNKLAKDEIDDAESKNDEELLSAEITDDNDDTNFKGGVDEAVLGNDANIHDNQEYAGEIGAEETMIDKFEVEEFNDESSIGEETNREASAESYEGSIVSKSSTGLQRATESWVGEGDSEGIGSMSPNFEDEDAHEISLDSPVESKISESSFTDFVKSNSIGEKPPENYDLTNQTSSIYFDAALANAGSRPKKDSQSSQASRVNAVKSALSKLHQLGPSCSMVPFGVQVYRTDRTLQKMKLTRTCQLNPMVKFSSDEVKKVMRGKLIRATDKMKAYDGSVAGANAKRIAGEIRNAVQSLYFDRYRYIVNVTIAEKIYHGLHTDGRLLWDKERDGLALHTEETPSYFIQAICYGIYKD